MGFKSVMKKVGKVAQFAAPFALDFVPGGQLLHLAMAAGLGAATSKGGVKSRLIGAGIGAGGEYAGNVLKGGKFNPVKSGKRGIISLGGAPAIGGATKTAASSTLGAAPGESFSDALSAAEGTPVLASKSTSSLLGSPGVDFSKMPSHNVPTGPEVGAYVPPPEGFAHKLLTDPKLYEAGLAMLGNNQNPGDSRKAYGINADDSLNKAFASARALQGQVASHTGDYSVPSPVNVNGTQIAGGLATSPEEERARLFPNRRG